MEDFKIKQIENSRLVLVAKLQQEQRNKVDECVRLYSLKKK